MLGLKARSTWFPQVQRPEPLIVRTNNQKQEWSDHDSYRDRLAGTARAFRANWPLSIGLIGAQEVGDTVPGNSGGTDENVRGIDCFAQALGTEFRTETRAAGDHAIGIVVGHPWCIESTEIWEIGKESWKRWTFPGGRGRRYLLETLISNRVKPWYLRFYSTHLSHGEVQRKQRKTQARKIASIIRERPQAGELPPILVGDFNATAEGEPDVFTEIAGLFQLAHARDYDQIWTGRGSSFPQCKGGYRLLGVDVVDLVAQGLSDHDAPVTAFQIACPQT